MSEASNISAQKVAPTHPKSPHDPCLPLLAKQEAGELVVTSVGAGYVGAMTAITLACKNPTIRFKVCDINQRLIDRWNESDLPFYEP